MGFEYGRNVIGSTGAPIMVAAAEDTIWQPIGVSIDWSLVTAVGADVTSPEGFIVKNGSKWLRYGQVLCKVTTLPAQTATITGTPAGGTFTLSGTRPDTGGYSTTAAIPYNETAANVQAALVAAFPGYSFTVSGSAGGPYTITSPLGQLTATGAFTGGTSPAIATAVTVAGANAGKYGPYDFAATDGRQTVARGNVCILNQSVMELGVLQFMSQSSTNHPGCLVGGLVWRERIIATTGTHSLAAGPTFTELEAALPTLRYVQGA